MYEESTYQKRWNNTHIAALLTKRKGFVLWKGRRACLAKERASALSVVRRDSLRVLEISPSDLSPAIAAGRRRLYRWLK